MLMTYLFLFAPSPHDVGVAAVVEERGGGVEAAAQGPHLCQAAPPVQAGCLVHMRTKKH